MKVSAQYAEEHFADILSARDKGEEVEIARPDAPTYRLELVKPVPGVGSYRPRHEVWGAWEGLLTAPTQEEWDAIHQQFLDEMPDFSKVDGGPA